MASPTASIEISTYVTGFSKPLDMVFGPVGVYILPSCPLSSNCGITSIIECTNIIIKIEHSTIFVIFAI
jgi:hypothetical protein